MLHKIKILEILLLILVGFSPLIPQSVRVLIVVSLILLNYKYFKRANVTKYFFLIMFMLVFILNLVIDFGVVSSIRQLNGLSIYFPATFLLGFIISQKYKLKELLSIFDKIIFFFAFFSLIGVVTYTFFPNVVHQLPLISYGGLTRTRTAFIFNVLLEQYYTHGILPRNAGIAWEPGAFQFILNMGLYSHTKIATKIDYRRVAIYLVAILATQSTSAYIIILFILFNLMLKDKKILFILLATSIPFAPAIIREINQQINHHLFGSVRFNLRFEPFIHAIQTGINSIIGLGNAGFDNNFRNIYRVPFDSIGQITIRYGLPLLLLISSRLIFLLKSNFILTIIIFVTFLSQNIWFFPMVTPFYFYLKEGSNEENESLTV